MLPDAPHVRLDPFHVPVPPAGKRLVQEKLQASEVFVQFGLNVIAPERRRALHQVVRAAEFGDEVRVAAIMPGGLLKFII